MAEKITPDIVIISGMSGSGRTQALHVFEDMGYFCIDNLPPSLILSVAQLVGINSGVGKHLAIVSDRRSQDLFEEFENALAQLSDHELSYNVVFLDAKDEVLISRYSENRRRHPLAEEGEALKDSIARERELLQVVRDHADLVIDTSSIKPLTLKNKLHRAYSELSDQQQLEVNVFSFGFKHGMPVEADLMIDVRFLPNPFYEPELRPMTGLDEKVQDYVLESKQAQEFLKAWKKLLDVVMPGYVSEGKASLSIAVGCTGGQHRSVVITEQTAAYLTSEGYTVHVTHPDLARLSELV